MKRIGFLAAAGYIGTIFAANWAVQRYGVVPVGFGLMAPAAVYLVGLAFTLRDLVQSPARPSPLPPGVNRILGARLRRLHGAEPARSMGAALSRPSREVAA